MPAVSVDHGHLHHRGRVEDIERTGDRWLLMVEEWQECVRVVEKMGDGVEHLS